MKKTLTAVVAAATFATAAIATPTPADARRGWWGPALGGLFAGAIIASAFARPSYGGYYGGYGSYYGGYGYPAYGGYYGYSAPAYYAPAYYAPAYYAPVYRPVVYGGFYRPRAYYGYGYRSGGYRYRGW